MNSLPQFHIILYLFPFDIVLQSEIPGDSITRQATSYVAKTEQASLPQLKTLLLERLELGGGRDLANTCLDASATNRYRAGATISLFARVFRLVSQFADRVLERGALLDFDTLAVVRQLGTASAAGVTAAAEECIGRSDESDGEDSEDGSDACVHGIGMARTVGMESNRCGARVPCRVSSGLVD